MWNVVAEGDKGPAYQHTLMLKYALVVGSGVTAYLHASSASRRAWRSSARSRAHRAGHAVVGIMLARMTNPTARVWPGPA